MEPHPEFLYRGNLCLYFISCLRSVWKRGSTVCSVPRILSSDGASSPDLGQSVEINFRGKYETQLFLNTKWFWSLQKIAATKKIEQKPIFIVLRERAKNWFDNLIPQLVLLKTLCEKANYGIWRESYSGSYSYGLWRDFKIAGLKLACLGSIHQFYAQAIRKATLKYFEKNNVD